jgi:competence protein ComGC
MIHRDMLRYPTMVHLNCKMKHSAGFTLVELAIVLIIVGFIIGGLLMGRDLITSSAIRSQIAQIEEYKIAVNTFRLKYNYLPGDILGSVAEGFGFSTAHNCDGRQQGARDGNGFIHSYIGGAKYAGVMGETGLFWADLSIANLIDGNYVVPGLPSRCNGGWYSNLGHFPRSRISQTNYIYVYELGNHNWYGLSEVTGFVLATMQSSATLPTITAYNIDSKMDDGYPTRGTVVARHINGSQSTTTMAPNAATASSTTCYDTTSSRYSTSQNNGNNPTCALSFRF